MNIKEQAKITAKKIAELNSEEEIKKVLKEEIDKLSISEAKEFLLFTEDQCNLSTLKNAKAASIVAKSVRQSLK